MSDPTPEELALELLDLPTLCGRDPGVLARRCRYGENPWQKPAGLYATPGTDPLALPRFELVAGGDPSYINWCDVDRGLTTLTHIAAALAEVGETRHHVAVVLKHGNACGAGVSSDFRKEALEAAIDGDPEAAFGGVVITNFPVESYCGVVLRNHRVPHGGKRILDGLVAPDIPADTVDELRRKDGKGFFLVNPALGHLSKQSLSTETIIRQVRGGFLTQPNFSFVLDWLLPELSWYGPEPTIAKKNNLLLARAVGSTGTSNTITLANRGRILANATGQQSRVLACELALMKARRADNDIAGAVAYSDSFFPFPDGPKLLIDAGVTAILASSGSIRDEQTIRLCEEHKVSLCLIPDALGRGFYGH
ncbi:MAG: hypothetical protein HY340_02530 [Candidatus Kerfeldbacteria bacterium]|nr:hypothetical protein [Candidatus Kerfeldbacteria bacterium]